MKTIHLQQPLPPDLSALRLDQALSKLFPTYSRGQHQIWIHQSNVQIDGKVCTKPRTKVFAGQIIVINASLAESERWVAQDIPLEIIYEDDSLLVINKPVGLVVHPGAGKPDQTLVNALLHYAPELKTIPRAGIIHRLDRDTSGLLVIARTLEAHHALVKAMQERKIKREYEAIAQGVITAGGTITTQMGRHPIHRTRMAVVQQGRIAITHYRVIQRFRAHTYVRVNLETGRTHQIRVHFEHIHHPLVGDTVYGRQRVIPTFLSEPLKQMLGEFKRQALHAARLELIHPQTGQLCQWAAPLPQDMVELLQQLKEDAEYAN